MTGYAFHGACFPALADALQAECVASYPVSSFNADGQQVTLSCGGASGASLTILRAVDGAASGSFSHSPVYAECSTTDVTSGVITPDLAFEAFAWGFTGVILCYCVAWGCGQVLSMLNVRS